MAESRLDLAESVIREWGSRLGYTTLKTKCVDLAENVIRECGSRLGYTRL